MSNTGFQEAILQCIVERISVGIVAVDGDMNVVLWNRFMEIHSGRSSGELVGRDLFSCFPELPRAWLERKLRNVFQLGSFAFSSWEERPYLFQFPHNRPITGGVDYMQQDCTFIPVKDASGKVVRVCITILDATDTYVYQRRLHEAMGALEEASRRDALTGCFSRAYLEEQLALEFHRVKRYGGELSLILFDLDHFKRVNDVYGHLAGDEVLRTVIDRLRRPIRSLDLLGRYGGEEFVLVLPGTELGSAMMVGERVRMLVAQEPVAFQSALIPVSISLGVTTLRSEVKRYEDLIQEADLALYQSKAQGRNRTSCHFADIKPPPLHAPER